MAFHLFFILAGIALIIVLLPYLFKALALLLMLGVAATALVAVVCFVVYLGTAGILGAASIIAGSLALVWGWHHRRDWMLATVAPR